MTCKVITYIDKVLEFICYSFYVLHEGIFRTSNPDPDYTIISVNAQLGFVFGMSFGAILVYLKELLTDYDFPYLTFILIILPFFIVWKVLGGYCIKFHRKIIKRYEKDNRLTKLLFILIAGSLMLFVLYFIVIIGDNMP